MVSCTKEFTKSRELARAVLRADAVLVASLMSLPGSLFCSCSAYTLRIFCSFLVVFFSVGCGEGSAMTGTAALLPRMVLQCAGDVGGGCCSSEYGLQRVVRGSVQG